MAFSSSLQQLQKQLWKKFLFSPNNITPLLTSSPCSIQRRSTAGAAAFSSSSSSSKKRISDAQWRAEFEKWTINFGVTFDTPYEKEKSFKNYKKCQRRFRNPNTRIYCAGALTSTGSDFVLHRLKTTRGVYIHGANAGGGGGGEASVSSTDGNNKID